MPYTLLEKWFVPWDCYQFIINRQRTYMLYFHLYPYLYLYFIFRDDLGMLVWLLGNNFGTVLGPFGAGFGMVLGSFWDDFGTIVGCISGPFGDDFGMMLEPLWRIYLNLWDPPLVTPLFSGDVLSFVSMIAAHFISFRVRLNRTELAPSSPLVGGIGRTAFSI